MTKKIEVLAFPLFVKWYITGKCNLRCEHCYLTDYRKEAPFALVKDILALLQAKGCLEVSYLGGEPLVRDDLIEIVAHTTKAGLASHIATNGVLVTTQIARQLWNAGLRTAQVSLEGHSPELSDPIRGKGTFEKALEGAQILRAQGMWTKVAFTLSSLNVESLSSLFQCASEAGANELKLAAFVPLGTGSERAKHLMLDSHQVSLIKDSLPQLRRIYPNMRLETAFLRDEAQANIAEERCTYGCGAGTHSMVINNDLSLSACDLLTEEDRTPFRINNPEDIEREWQKNNIFRKWRGMADPGDRTTSITDFSEVHQHGCHVAYNLYGKNILE